MRQRRPQEMCIRDSHNVDDLGTGLCIVGHLRVQIFAVIRNAAGHGCNALHHGGQLQQVGKGVLVAGGTILAIQPVLIPFLAVIFLACLLPTGMEMCIRDRCVHWPLWSAAAWR